MSFTRTTGAKIYWKLEGEKDRPALVLLNSIGCDMDLWDAVLPMLRPRFGVLRIDTRGHGASDAPEGDYSLDLLAQDTLAVMDEAGVHSAVLAGVSLGGMIAMEAALRAPSRINALALVCTSATMARAAWDERVRRVRAEGVGAIVDLAMSRFLSPSFIAARPDVAATVRRGLLAMAPAGYAGCAAAIRDMALIERLGAIRAPTLVVTGAHDASTPLEPHGRALLAAIPGARHIALEAAHLAPLDAPEAMAEALLAFSEA